MTHRSAAEILARDPALRGRLLTDVPEFGDRLEAARACGDMEAFLGQCRDAGLFDPRRFGDLYRYHLACGDWDVLLALETLADRVEDDSGELLLTAPFPGSGAYPLPLLFAAHAVSLASGALSPTVFFEWAEKFLDWQEDPDLPETEAASAELVPGRGLWRPVHWAASLKSRDALRWLLERGASPDGFDADSDADRTAASPLHICVELEDEDGCLMLLAAGADPNLCTDPDEDQEPFFDEGTAFDLALRLGWARGTLLMAKFGAVARPSEDQPWWPNPESISREFLAREGDPARLAALLWADAQALPSRARELEASASKSGLDSIALPRSPWRRIAMACSCLFSKRLEFSAAELHERPDSKLLRAAAAVCSQDPAALRDALGALSGDPVRLASAAEFALASALNPAAEGKGLREGLLADALRAVASDPEASAALSASRGPLGASPAGRALACGDEGVFSILSAAGFADGSARSPSDFPDLSAAVCGRAFGLSGATLAAVAASTRWPAGEAGFDPMLLCARLPNLDSASCAELLADALSDSIPLASWEAAAAVAHDPKVFLALAERAGIDGAVSAGRRKISEPRKVPERIRL